MRDQHSLILIICGVFIVPFLAFYKNDWLWAGINVVVFTVLLMLRRRAMARNAV